MSRELGTQSRYANKFVTAQSLDGVTIVFQQRAELD